MFIIKNSRNLPSSLDPNSAGAVFGRIHRGPPGPDDDTGRASSAAKDRPMWFGWMDYERAARSGPAKRTTRSEGSGSRPVSRVLSRAVIHLRRTSPYACSDLPGSGAGHASSPTGDALPYLVLLRVGFTLPPVLPPARCALTAPFHPYPASSRTHTTLLRGHIPRLLHGHIPRCCAGTYRAYCAGTRRSVFCGTFRGLAPPRRYLAPCPSEPGLSSASKFEAATAQSAPARHSVT